MMGELVTRSGGCTMIGELATRSGGCTIIGECVAGAATALLADRARAEPRTTHETFNHDVIGYTPVFTTEPAQSLTQTVHFGTTKVPRGLKKIAR